MVQIPHEFILIDKFEQEHRYQVFLKIDNPNDNMTYVVAKDCFICEDNLILFECYVQDEEYRFKVVSDLKIIEKIKGIIEKTGELI